MPPFFSRFSSSLSLPSLAPTTLDADGTPVFDPLPADAINNPKFDAIRDIYASTPSIVDAAPLTPEVIHLGETDC